MMGGDAGQTSRQTFVCGGCARTFRSPQAIGGHYAKSEGCREHADRHRKFGTGFRRKRRHRPTWRQKREILTKVTELNARGCHNSQSLVAREEAIPLSTLNDWWRDRYAIYNRAAAHGVGSKRALYPSTGRYPYEETLLYMRFLYRRLILRLPVSYSWLQRHMRRLVAKYSPTDCKGFTGSNGWVTGFCKRWRITRQCMTNKHKLSLEDRLGVIRRFHRWLIYELQRSPPQRCPKYGRFPPELMFHMDQVPISFAPDIRRTLNPLGARCSIAQTKSGDSKRMATMQVCICAAKDKSKQLKIELLYFGQGKRVAQEEKDLYARLTNLRVRFQKKAWADERIMKVWLEDFREETLDRGEVLLGMDNHTAQATPWCRLFMHTMGIVSAFTPANCTDCTSPVDRHVGQTIKLKTRKMYNLWMDEQVEQTGLGNVRVTNSQRRMLLAQWVSDAWDDVCTNHLHLIQRAFVTTGFLVAKDGSENHLIDLSNSTTAEGQKKKGEEHFVYDF